MSITFGTKWCCNRSLADICFENCIFDGVFKESEISCPEEEPLSKTFKNCTLIAPEKGRNLPLINGKNIKQVRLENVRFEGFDDPQILCQPPAEIIVE